MVRIHGAVALLPFLSTSVCLWVNTHTQMCDLLFNCWPKTHFDWKLVQQKPRSSNIPTITTHSLTSPFFTKIVRRGFQVRSSFVNSKVYHFLTSTTSSPPPSSSCVHHLQAQFVDQLTFETRATTLVVAHCVFVSMFWTRVYVCLRHIKLKVKVSF